ncbi:MAG: low molecular weight phosphotyrosine protein phosphatase [Bacteroidia bacterium]|nr:low molecular weight phosphotyrosine protein phosphatase [Bacteroidia bacterium]
MQKILFVCLGNICRSPLAEGILLHLKEKQHLPFEIDSAGTAGYHIGEAPDPRTIANARKNGVDLSALRARQFQASDFDKFDWIFTMDKSNYNNLLKLTSNKEQQQKLKLFLEFATGQNGAEVPDPYYGNEKDFEKVFQLVYSASLQLCEKLNSSSD